jgi:hypothetical protein
MTPFVVHAYGDREPPNRRSKKMSDTKQSAKDVAILEQLNLDYNQADQASDAKRFSELLAEDFIVETPGVTRNRVSGQLSYTFSLPQIALGYGGLAIVATLFTVLAARNPHTDMTGNSQHGE